MTLRFEGGALTIRDDAGNLKFSSDENLFTITDFVDSRVNGALAIPQSQATATEFGAAYVNIDQNIFIANVNPAANIVFGMIQLAPDGGEDSTTNGSDWIQANGTNVYTWNSTGVLGEAASSHQFANTLGLLTAFISGGQLFLKRRIVQRAHSSQIGTFTTTTRPFTINYRFYCGTFI